MAVQLQAQAYVLNLDTVVSGSPKNVTVAFAVSMVGYGGQANATLLSVDNGFQILPMTFFASNGEDGDDYVGWYATETPCTMALGDGTAINMNYTVLACGANFVAGAMAQNNTGADMVGTANWNWDALESVKATLTKKGKGYLLKASSG